MSARAAASIDVRCSSSRICTCERHPWCVGCSWY
jgi:hypothetical protein